MVRMQLKVSRDMILDRAFNRVHILARRDAGAVADAEDMGINGLRRLAPPHVQHDIGGLAPHTRQRLQGGA